MSPASPVVVGRSKSRSSRPAVLAAALAALAIVAAGGIGAGYLIQRDDSATAPAAAPTASASASPSAASAVPASSTGGFTPAACSGPVPANAPRTPQKGAARGTDAFSLYPGWSFFTDGAGFRMPVPDRWTYQKFGTTYCLRDPSSARMMILDVGRRPTADPLAACKQEATRVKDTHALPHYQLVTLEPKTLLDKAADWEYTYQAPDGTPMYVQTQWQATKGKAYALAWATRQLDWSGDFATFSMVLSSVSVQAK